MDGLPLQGLEDASRPEPLLSRSFLTRSHQQRLRQLLASRDDAEAGPAVHRVERRHLVDGLSTDRPPAPVASDHREHIPIHPRDASFTARADSREHGQPGGDQHKRCAGRAVRLCVDPLHRGRGLVHEQRISFGFRCGCVLHGTKYPQYNIHKKQHSVGTIIDS